MKRITLAAAVIAAAAVTAAPTKTRKASSDDAVTTGRAAKILIEQAPRLGQQTCLNAPGIAGATLIGQCYKKPRQWIVLEMKYATFGTEKSKFQDQLTFTWHVMLETKSATENKGNREGLAPYSYFTTSVTYSNIPMGSHASSVVLPPSYRERYGEPKAVAVVITNQNGEELAGDCWSEIKYVEGKFWENAKVMDATGKDGKPLVERRQGLLDRSKTIWALVNPNDYEATVQ